MVLNFHIPNNFLVLAAISAKLLISNIRFSWKWELPMTSSVSNEYALLPNMNVQVKLERQEAICTMTFDGVI